VDDVRAVLEANLCDSFRWLTSRVRFRIGRLKEAALFAAGGRYGISIDFGLEVVEREVYDKGLLHKFLSGEGTATVAIHHSYIHACGRSALERAASRAATPAELHSHGQSVENTPSGRIAQRHL
jgi:hypothetical protein